MSLEVSLRYSEDFLGNQIDNFLKDRDLNININTNEFDYNFLKICYPDKVYMGKDRKNAINVEYTIEGKLKVFVK